MKKGYLLGILFFSGLWGASEAILGGFLYKDNIAYASIPLTIIAFIILTVAKIYLPQKGSLVLIGFIAMFYKFLNAPFFACHLLAIFFLGLSYEVVFDFFRIKSKAMLGLLATYLGYILFALTITYIFRYPYWIESGFLKVLNYIGVSGTMAAFANFVVVPVSFNFGQMLKKGIVNPFEFKSGLATGSVSLITLGLWLMGVIRCS